MWFNVENMHSVAVIFKVTVSIYKARKRRKKVSRVARLISVGKSQNSKTL